jgi:putative membrane protein
MNRKYSRFCTLALSALTLSTVLAAQTPADNDKAFTGKVSQGGLYEVLASKYAATKASAPDVKDLALAEVHDHELVNQNLKKVATSAGVAIVPGLNTEFKERLEKLKAVPAADFDAAYIADMRAIHDKDEKLFAQEAMDGSDAYKTFAHQTDLIVKRHIGALHGLDK